MITNYGTLKMVTVDVDVLSMLYGYYPAERTTRLFNYYILLGKRYIFVQRLESYPSF